MKGSDILVQNIKSILSHLGPGDAIRTIDFVTVTDIDDPLAAYKSIIINIMWSRGFSPLDIKLQKSLKYYIKSVIDDPANSLQHIVAFRYPYLVSRRPLITKKYWAWYYPKDDEDASRVMRGYDNTTAGIVHWIYNKQGHLKIEKSAPKVEKEVKPHISEKEVEVSAAE